MDSIKGAQELTRLLEERHGVMPEAVPPAPLSDSAAPPIFHWVGVEPPLALVEQSAGHRRGLARYLPRLPWRVTPRADRVVPRGVPLPPS
jgi:hypothetical protein